VEIVLGFVAIGLQASKPLLAVLLGFATLVMTFWKTVAYMGSDYIVGYPNTAHNDLNTWIWLYFVPSFVWLLVPALGIKSLGGQLLALTPAGKPKAA